MAQMISTLNPNRMSCKTCLSVRLWINDNDDTDDTGETTVWLSVISLGLGFVKFTPFRL